VNVRGKRVFKGRCKADSEKKGNEGGWTGGSVVCHATPPSGNEDISHEHDSAKMIEDRICRLEVALTLRKLYRNLLRADLLLQFPSPIYKAEELETEVAAGIDAMSPTDPSEAAAAAQKKVDEAIDFVAELELTAEELRVCFGHDERLVPCLLHGKANNYVCCSADCLEYSKESDIRLGKYIPGRGYIRDSGFNQRLCEIYLQKACG